MPLVNYNYLPEYAPTVEEAAKLLGSSVARCIHCRRSYVTAHMYCRECCRARAELSISQGQYKIFCISRGCQEYLSRLECEKFVTNKLRSALILLEARSRGPFADCSDLVDLSRCPFCDYVVQSSPDELESDFECQRPGCLKHSCRACDRPSHAPAGCFAVLVRYQEAERLPRDEDTAYPRCNDCQKLLERASGYNRVVCTGCGNVQCFHCGDSINTGTSHRFRGILESHTANTCPIFDSSQLTPFQHGPPATLPRELPQRVRAIHVPDFVQRWVSLLPSPPDLSPVSTSPPIAPLSVQRSVGMQEFVGAQDVDQVGAEKDSSSRGKAFGRVQPQPYQNRNVRSLREVWEALDRSPEAVSRDSPGPSLKARPPLESIGGPELPQVFPGEDKMEEEADSFGDYENDQEYTVVQREGCLQPSFQNSMFHNSSRPLLARSSVGSTQPQANDGQKYAPIGSTRSNPFV